MVKPQWMLLWWCGRHSAGTSWLNGSCSERAIQIFQDFHNPYWLLLRNGQWMVQLQINL